MIENIRHILLVAAVTSLAGAQDMQGELTAWRDRHGANWRASVDQATGHLEMLYGGSTRALPRLRKDADWVSLARRYVLETENMHGIASGDLSGERVVFLPLGKGNGTDKITVRLRQAVGGVPVENGAINALFNTRGQLLSLHSTGAPHLSGTQASATVSADLAAATAAAIFSGTLNLVPNEVGTPELIFVRVEESGVRSAHLAWQIDIAFHQDLTVPVSYRYTIDAGSAQVLRRDDNIHHCDVGGTIDTNATGGTEADHPGNPAQPLPAGHVRITSSAGTTFADSGGNFNYPGVTGPLNITATYLSPWADVDNQSGGDYSITFNNVTGTANTLLMNPNPNELLTAQANGMRQVGLSRDFIRDTNAADSTGDFVAVTNVNQASSCGAFFNGSSINFFTSGSGCNNTAYSTVISHEWGHWVNALYGTGNGSDGMGEGNADLWALYIHDTPLLGEFFFTGGGFIRSGNNTRQFCGDTNSSCHGSVHADGEVWMGAGWKVRRNLNTALGDALGDATANQLFLGWMNGFDQTQIRSIIETQWLMLDDDDGDITNGTPNYPEIDSAFREQGFPGVDITIPCTPPVIYCVGAPNSVGAGARVLFVGSQSIADDDANLFLSDAPPLENGLFLYGMNPTSLPVGDGVLCIGATFHRIFPAVQTDMFGLTSLQIPISNPPVPAAQITSGSTWNFQFWYRDGGGVIGNNLSDAIEVSFCD